jgi:UDP-N-acetylmuramate-alanine ligase
MLNEEVNTAYPARSGMHFVGICGTAMASVAAMCRELGHAVTGSDENVYPPMSTFLAEKKIAVMNGYAEQNLAYKPDLVVIGNAISRGNPEAEFVLDHKLLLAAGTAQGFFYSRQTFRCCHRHAWQDDDDFAARLGVRT